MNQLAQLHPDHLGRVRRPISIQRLLEWAFAAECASIDFEDPGTLAVGFGPSGNAHRMAQRGALGCRIDGGGRSYPDADADLVASAVAMLPEGCGGRRMAVRIAELSRCRQVPEAYVGVVQRYAPREWRQNRHGKFAATEHVEYVWDRSGRKAKQWDVRVCPVSVYPQGAVIAAARREYLQWWSALQELRVTFEYRSDLSRWYLTSDMPPLRPWQKNC